MPQGGKQSAIGVYWGPSSTFNLSRIATKSPFTNQRAELEAILAALTQAQERKLPQLILFSDSSYAIECINNHRHQWKLTKTADDKEQMLVDATGKEPKNSDLFIPIFNIINDHQCSIHFQHIVRSENEEADALANAAFRSLYPLDKRFICLAETRNQQRLRESKQIPPWDAARQERELKGDFDDNECVIFLYDDDDEEDDEGQLPPVTEWKSNEEIEEQEECPVLEAQLNTFPSMDHHEADEYDVLDLNEPLPTQSSGPPGWTSDLVPMSTENKSNRLPPILRLEAPQLNKLLEIMTLLPRAQKEDDELKEIISHLQFPGRQPLSKQLDKKMHQYSLNHESGTLNITMKDGRIRLMTPKSLQVPLIELYHRSPVMGGHPGSRATYMHVQRYFYWKEMLKQIMSYVESCPACIAANKITRKVPGLLTNYAFLPGPFKRVHGDTIKSLPQSANHKHALVVMDSYTKFVCSYPLRSMHPFGIVEGLTILFTHLGPPEVFIADNGSEFHNKETILFLELWGVQWKFPAPYNPQANGQAEAGVKIISQKLRRTLTDLSQRDNGKFPMNKWSIILPYVVWAYNSSPNEMTGFAPYELVFGRMPPLPQPHLNDLALEKKWLEKKPFDYLIQLQHALQEAHEIVNEKTMHRRQQIKERYDSHRSELLLNVGDFVYITWPFSKKLLKLEPRCYGPFPVTKVIRCPDTDDIVSIECNVASSSDEEPIIKRYPRRRIRLVRSTLPSTEWSQLESLLQPADDDEEDCVMASPEELSNSTALPSDHLMDMLPIPPPTTALGR